jgi:hypothetical protein
MIQSAWRGRLLVKAGLAVGAVFLMTVTPTGSRTGSSADRTVSNSRLGTPSKSASRNIGVAVDRRERRRVVVLS